MSHAGHHGLIGECGVSVVAVIKNDNQTSLELVFFVDRSGLASEFREGRGAQLPKGRRLTLDEWTRISQKYGTTHKTLE